MRSDTHRRLLGAVSLLVLPTMAAAQENEAAGSTSEIVVTALKRNSSLLEVPAAVSVLGGDALERRGIEGVDDIQFAVPSLQSGKLLGTTGVIIRGVGLLSQGSPGVAIHSDGVYQPRPAMGDLVQADLDRVEVLRGPQGTLYGRNANGGAINFVTKAPTDRLEGHVQASVATYEEYRLQGVLNLPLAQGIRARGVIAFQDRNRGFVKNIAGGPDVDKGRSLSGRLRLAVDLADNLTADFAIFRLEDDGPTSYFILNSPPNAAAVARSPFLAGAIIPTKPFQTTIDGRSDFRRRYSGGSLTLTLDTSPISLKSITGYSKLTDDFYTDSDASNVGAFSQHNVNRTKVFTQEFNAVIDTDPLDMVIGAYYMDDRAPAFLQGEFPLGASPLPAGGALQFNVPKHRTQALAVFADGTVNVTEKMRLIGGARYSIDDLEVRKRHALFIPIGASRFESLTCQQSFRTSFESFTPRVGMQVDIDDQRNVYATYSRGFKAGGFNLTSCGQSYKPEKVTAYEAGFKGWFADRTLSLGAAAFYYDYTDLQLQQIVGLTSIVSNAGKAEVMGVEAELTWTPDDRWTVNANGTLLKATYSSFTNVDSLQPALGVQNLKGNDLSNAPRRSANLGIAYRAPAVAGGALTARIDASYRSRIYFREFNAALDSQKSYALVNLGLTWDSEDEAWRLRLFANNLFDKAYYSRMGASDVLGARYISFGARRQIGIEVRRNF